MPTITTIRQSSLGMWENCPEQFRRRVIEGEIIPPGLAAHIGTGVHKGAEVNHRAKLVTGMDEPLSVIQDAARDGYVHAVHENKVYFPLDELPGARKATEEGVDQVTALARTYREELAPTIRPKLVEQWAELEVPGVPYPITGTVDLVDERNALIDIKTAARAWPQAKADDTPQATIYQQLVKALTGAPPSEIRFEVFVKTKTPKHQTVTTTRDDNDFTTLLERIKIMVKMIDNGIFPPAPSGSWVCSPKYCGYFYTCPHVPNSKKTLPKRSE